MKKRKLMDELAEGFDALAQQRSRKRTLRTHIVVLKRRSQSPLASWRSCARS